MLTWTMILLLIALLSGLLGFGGFSPRMALAARVTCLAFMALFVLSLFIRGDYFD